MSWRKSLTIASAQFAERAKLRPRIHAVRFGGFTELQELPKSAAYSHLSSHFIEKWGDSVGASHDGAGFTTYHGDEIAYADFGHLAKTVEPVLQEFVRTHPGVISWHRFLPTWHQALFAVGHKRLPGSALSVSYSVFDESYGTISVSKPFSELPEAEIADLTKYSKGKLKLPPPWFFEEIKIDLFTASHLAAEYILSFPDQSVGQPKATCIFWPVTVATPTADFKRKELYLDSRTVDPITMVSIRLLNTLGTMDRRILKFRHHFSEIKPNQDDFAQFLCITLIDYIEDEPGKETSLAQVIGAKHGGRGILIPPGARQHDIDLMIEDNSPPHPDPANAIQLSQDDVDCLGYFLNDVAELSKTQFFRSDGPALEHSQGSTGFRLKNLSLDNVRAYILPFRKLYLEEERGNFTKACNTYVRHFLNKRITKWVHSEKKCYHKELKSISKPFFFEKKVTFTTRELIEAFLYTRFVHQPKPDAILEYNKIVAELGDPTVAEWLFYSALRRLACFFVNVYPYIQNEYSWYVNVKQLSPRLVLPEMSTDPNRRLRPKYRPIATEALRAHSAMLADELKSDPALRGMSLAELLAYCEQQLKAKLEIIDN